MIPTIRIAASCAFLALVSLAATAAPPTISTVTSIAGLAYSPDAKAKATGTVTVLCNGYIGSFYLVFNQLSLLPATSPPADPLTFALYNPKKLTTPLAMNGVPTAKAQVLTGSFPTGSTSTTTVPVSFVAQTTQTTIPPPATYTSTIVASLYASAYPTTAPPVSTFTFTVQVVVGSISDLSVVRTGRAFSLTTTSQALAFGTLVPNASKGADVVIRSNVSYGLTITSTNGGLLNAGDSSLIGYTLTSNGTPLSLPAGIAATIANAGPTYSTLARYALLATITGYGDMPTEGSYSDTLTVTLTAP
jgi:hypothetical protein